MQILLCMIDRKFVHLLLVSRSHVSEVDLIVLTRSSSCACVQLQVTGLRGGDGAIKTSYRLLGAASLLQLLITVALQLNSFRQKQRARQEWRRYRKLRCVSDPNCTRTSKVSV